MTEKEKLYYTARAIDSVLTCCNGGINLPDILKHLEKIKNEHGGCYVHSYVNNNSKTYANYDIFLDRVSKFKEIIADFAGIDLNDVSLQPSINALKDAYDLDTAAAFNTKIYQLIASDTQQNDSFEQFQPGIHAFMDAYDIDTAAAFNTKIYQLIASDIQDSKTNSALQQQLAALCNQVETLTGQVQQLSEQIQQLKNSPTKSE